MGRNWGHLPSSHGAAIAFDLAAAGGLFFFGTRLRPGRRGRELGIVCAFAWLAYPYTDFALQANSNDSLIAAFIIWSLALFARPVTRGVVLALATMTKFAPIALAPLFAAGYRGLMAGDRDPSRGRVRALLGSWRAPATFAAAFVVVCGLLLIHPAIDAGLATFYDRTIRSQIDRTSPFSLWGQVDGIQWLQNCVFVATAALGILVAFVPARRTLPQIAALAASVMLALQLSVDHWFYLYIPWFFGAMVIALAAIGETGTAPRERPPADTPEPVRPPAPIPS